MSRTPRANVSLTPDDMGKKAAREVAAVLREKPNAVIGLATGDTQKPMYKELRRMFREEGLDFSRATFFNLDEYVGLPPDHPQSYHHYMDEQLFNHVNVDRNNVHIPDGMAKDIDQECRNYEKAIKMATGGQGMDLQVLGIGTNGHIGFAEPGTSFSTGTHKVTLTEETRESNMHNFGNRLEDVPKEAITMGPETIMSAQKILLLANGESKTDAVFKAFAGEVTPEVPASILQRHQDVTFFLDRKAYKDFDKYFVPTAVASAAVGML